MKLSEDQLKSVAAWFAGGASLDEIQKRLVSEFGVHVTYFDLRMIVADLPQPEEEGEDAGETPASQLRARRPATPNDGEPAPRTMPSPRPQKKLLLMARPPLLLRLRLMP